MIKKASLVGIILLIVSIVPSLLGANSKVNEFTGVCEGMAVVSPEGRPGKIFQSKDSLHLNLNSVCC